MYLAIIFPGRIEYELIYSLQGAKHREDYSVNIQWDQERYLPYCMYSPGEDTFIGKSPYASLFVNSWTKHNLSLEQEHEQDQGQGHTKHWIDSCLPTHQRSPFIFHRISYNFFTVFKKY